MHRVSASVTPASIFVSSVQKVLAEHLEHTRGLRTKPFDASAAPEAVLSDLSIDKLGQFLSRAQSLHGYALGPGPPTDAALAHLNLLDGGHPTHAAVLLFGLLPQKFLMSSEVKCMHFHGTEIKKLIQIGRAHV